MSSSIDPITNKPLPNDAIQRILFICPTVHVYQIPPLASTKGYQAGNWTHATNPTAKKIFTARIRILETAIPRKAANGSGDDGEIVSTAILLEDPATGALFAGAPYTQPSVVEQAVDSSRFFAVRVQGEGGMKATLGIGFEERAEAIDFGIALQDARKVMGLEAKVPLGRSKTYAEKEPAAAETQKRDLSLKDGETITVNIGNRAHRKTLDSNKGKMSEQDALFSIKPPPAAGGIPMLSPPPSAGDVKSERRRSRSPSGFTAPAPSTSASGFDDDFGDFQ